MADHQPQRGHVEWHGTLHEQLDLIASLQHNCECSFDVGDGSHTICSSHLMYANDQRALDGLLWTRHLAERLRSEEGIGVHDDR